MSLALAARGATSGDDIRPRAPAKKEKLVHQPPRKRHWPPVLGGRFRDSSVLKWPAATGWRCCGNWRGCIWPSASAVFRGVGKKSRPPRGDGLILAFPCWVETSAGALGSAWRRLTLASESYDRAIKTVAAALPVGGEEAVAVVVCPRVASARGGFGRGAGGARGDRGRSGGAGLYAAVARGIDAGKDPHGRGRVEA